MTEWCAMCAMRAGDHALHAVLCAALYTGGRGGLALFAGGAGGVEGAGGDSLCAALCMLRGRGFVVAVFSL